MPASSLASRRAPKASTETAWLLLRDAPPLKLPNTARELYAGASAAWAVACSGVATASAASAGEAIAIPRWSPRSSVMVSDGGGGAACGADNESIGAMECASCAGAMGKACATRSAAGTSVDEAKGCTFSCVPNEANAGSGLLGRAGLTGAGGGNAAGAIGATGGCTVVVATGGGATKGAGVITA